MKIKSIEHDQINIRLVFVSSILTTLFVLLHLFVSPVDAGSSLRIYDDGGGHEDGTQLVFLTLQGVTRYEITEIFNDILLKTPGVANAERIRLHLDPNRPRACYVAWRLKVRRVGLFELESRIYKIVKDIAHDSPEAPVIAFGFAPTKKDRRLLGFIRPFQSSSREIAFIMDHPSFRVKNQVNRNLWKRKTFPPPANWGNRGFE